MYIRNLFHWTSNCRRHSPSSSWKIQCFSSPSHCLYWSHCGLDKTKSLFRLFTAMRWNRRHTDCMGKISDQPLPASVIPSHCALDSIVSSFSFDMKSSTADINCLKWSIAFEHTKIKLISTRKYQQLNSYWKFCWFVSFLRLFICSWRLNKSVKYSKQVLKNLDKKTSHTVPKVIHISNTHESFTRFYVYAPHIAIISRRDSWLI